MEETRPSTMDTCAIEVSGPAESGSDGSVAREPTSGKRDESPFIPRML